MVTKIELLNNLSPYLGNKKILVQDQNTKDIISELLKSHSEQKNEYNKIYKYFNNSNKNKIFENLFNFCKKNIKYKIESGENQSLKTPSAILVQGYGDCKQYAQFIGGILDAINRNENKINWCYRFASYNPQKRIQHVFVVVKQGDKEIWIDPVLPCFNEKKQYTFKKDKTMLYSINGINDLDEISGNNKKIRKPRKKIKVLKGSTLVVPATVVKNVMQKNRRCLPKEQLTTEFIKEAKRQKKFFGFRQPQNLKNNVMELDQIGFSFRDISLNNIRKEVKGLSLNRLSDTVKKGFNDVKLLALKVALAPARNAYLALVSLNLLGMATKLANGIRKGAKVMDTWADLGGAPSALTRAIEKGSKSKISGINDFDNEIGAFPAVIAAAAPIIAKLSAVLRAVGVNPDELLAKAKNEIIKKVIKQTTKSGSNNNQNVIDPTPQYDAGIKTEITTEPTTNGQKSGNYTMTMTKDDTPSQSNDNSQLVKNSNEQPATVPIDYKKYIVPAGVLLGVYLLTKKK